MTVKKSKSKDGDVDPYAKHLVRSMQPTDGEGAEGNVLKRIAQVLKRHKETPPEEIIEMRKKLMLEIKHHVNEVVIRKAQLLSKGGEAEKLAGECEKLNLQAQALLSVVENNLGVGGVGSTENLRQLKEYADTYKKIKKEINKVIILADAEVQKYLAAVEAEKNKIVADTPKDASVEFADGWFYSTKITMDLREISASGNCEIEMDGDTLYFYRTDADGELNAELLVNADSPSAVDLTIMRNDKLLIKEKKINPTAAKHYLKKYYVDDFVKTDDISLKNKKAPVPAVTIDVSMIEPDASKKIDDLASRAPTVMKAPGPEPEPEPQKEPIKTKAEKLVLENNIAKIGKTEIDLSALAESGNYDLVYNESKGTIVIRNKSNSDHAARLSFDSKNQSAHLEQNVPSDADTIDGKLVVRPITNKKTKNAFADMAYDDSDNLKYALQRLFPELRPDIRQPGKSDETKVGGGDKKIDEPITDVTKEEPKADGDSLEITGEVSSEEESEQKIFIKDGVISNADHDFELNVNPLVECGRYDIENVKGGKLKITSKMDSKYSITLKHIGRGLLRLEKQDQKTGRKFGRTLEDYQAMEEMAKFFPELREEEKEPIKLTFDGKIIKGESSVALLDLSTIINAGNCDVKEEDGVLYFVGKGKYEHVEAKIRLELFDDKVPTKVRRNGKISLARKAHIESLSHLLTQLFIEEPPANVELTATVPPLSEEPVDPHAKTLPSTPPPAPEGMPAPTVTAEPAASGEDFTFGGPVVPPKKSEEVFLEEYGLMGGEAGRAKEQAAEMARVQNEKIIELTGRLETARVNFTNAFLEKEKYGGVIGGLKKLFFRKSTLAEVKDKYDTAWNEYAIAQGDLVEASKKQAEILRGFLSAEQQSLQKQIMEVRGKSKMEKFGKGVRSVEKGWKKLGDLNLFNAAKSFGINIDQSNFFARTALKAASVRTVISGACLVGGFSGIVPLAAARVAMSGFGGMTGSRQLMDGVQNSIQRRWGNRGNFFSDKKTAEEYLRKKYNVLDLGADDKATAKRRAKMEKELAQTDKFLKQYDDLGYSEKLEKVQERIAAVEATAYFDGVDLSADENYQRLLTARDRLVDAYIDSKAREAGDFELKVRPDDLKDMFAYLNTRKTEMDLTLKKMSQEKLLRGGKRLVSIAAGAALGAWSLARFAKHAAEMAAGANMDSTTATVSHAINTENVVSSSDQISPDLQAHLDKFGDNQTLREAFLSEARAHGNHDLDKIADAYVVHKGDGLERIIQRQLLLDPEKFGMHDQNILHDAGKLRQWAGHEARVIALKNHIDDKYFVYDAKHPQYLVVDENKNVIYEAKQLHTETEAMRAHRAGVETKPPAEGEPRKVFELRPGQGEVPKMLTGAEQAEYDRLYEVGDYEGAMDYHMQHAGLGQVYEMPDGTQTHEQNLTFDSLTHEGTAPVQEGAAGGQSVAPAAEHTTNISPVSAEERDADRAAAIAEENLRRMESANSAMNERAESVVDGAYAEAKFEHAADGSVVNMTLEQRATPLDLKIFRDAMLAKDADIGNSVEVNQKFSALGSADDLYKQMLSRGESNSDEAEYLRGETAKQMTELSKLTGRDRSDLFKADVLRKYGFNEDAIYAETVETANRNADL